ncbi:MAG TPA: ABC transporter permease, partial [Anaerolineae bacterium]|nr:ABC transporter permease [Anaerolineae bacterium]
LIVSGVIIALSSDQVLSAIPTALSNPLQFISTVFSTVINAYAALLTGALGNPVQVIAGMQTWITTGDASALLRSLQPISEGLVTSIPYIFTGLAVALGFKAGLFNIGAEGQLFMGAIFAVYVGYSSTGLPWFIHLPLAIIAGIAGGALWGAIPGFLKAKTGAHEVINTIMMNYIAFLLADWLLNGPMKAQGGAPRSPEIEASAYLPVLFPPPLRIHWGIFLAIGAVLFVYWFLWKTTLGFEMRTVGANPNAARYAGISITRNFVLAMGMSGGLAGLAGANELLGLNHYLANAFSPGYGFDAIALALLGKSNPFGVLAAALLFGFLRSGATHMQSVADVPIDIISVMQALIIAFIAAPAIIRWIYRLRTPTAVEREVFTRGWGG